MNSGDNGWSRISEQNENSIRQNKRKENLNTGYNISTGLIVVITVGALIVIAVCARLLGG